MLELKLEQKRSKQAADHLIRYQEEITQSDGSFVTVKGERLLSFSTNDYLGLAHHPAVINACQSALKNYGVGSGSAYLISGYTLLHKKLEEQLADFLNYPRVLLFSSGYLANIGTISALFSKRDSIFGDKSNHASIIDGCLASKADFKRYPHANTSILEHLCHQSEAANKLIVTEGIFGMDGTQGPLAKISQIAARHQARLMVDDAHGIGVVGATGRGSLEEQKLGHNEVTILTGTLGKAFGSYGAFVASSDVIIDSLIQSTRTYIYTTALPPAIAAASLASLEIIRTEHWRRERLRELIKFFKKGLLELGINHLDSDTPIQPIILESNQHSIVVSNALRQKGLFVKAIRPPTVPSARLRINITAEHTEQQLSFLLESLEYAIKQR
jgi:8-amino-7-oxononanoate synthase